MALVTGIGAGAKGKKLPPKAVEGAAILKPYQTMSEGQPPQSPAEFTPDPPISAPPPRLFPEEPKLELSTTISTNEPPAPPVMFNPDPGQPAAVYEPFYQTNFGLKLEEPSPVPEGLELPRGNVRSRRIVEAPGRAPDTYGRGALPRELQLPRTNTITTEHIHTHFHNLEYDKSRKVEYPPNTEPVKDRWRIEFVPWRRYTSGDTETPYDTPGPSLWHPYKQSILKGDLPIIGQDIFLNLTAGTQTEFEARRLPVPSGVSAARADSAEFYGRSEQLSVQQNFSFAAELFKGETVFQPPHWAFKIQPVFNVNYIELKEAGIVNPDPRGDFRDNSPAPDNSGVFNPGDVDGILNPGTGPAVGLAPKNLAGRSHTTRTRSHIALQEFFYEYHLKDLSVNYDFYAIKAGIQTFNSDFRGFIFNDSNLGVRLFGSAANNLFQYNLAYFDMLEKDTFSELNTLNARDQQVIVANVYRQDFIRKGYTALWSFHANLDNGDLHYDRNGVIARPSPIGTVREHDIDAFYFGWSGDGHIGRLNLSHSYYHVLGRDEFNGVAGRATDINAFMGALELSYDRDWIRYKASMFYASGDGDANDGKATGFDSILDNANFTGGPFSYWVRQGFNLGGTAVSMKARNSLLPDLRTMKAEGQANFVNPGLMLFGLGTDIELTPKLRSFINVNYLRFAETDVLKTVLMTDKIDEEIGFDLSLGFQYRPLLTDNIIISAGFGALIPGKGFTDIYRRNTAPVAGYGSNQTGKPDSFLYSGLFAVTFTY
ncbi:MAG: hypothetical protein H0X66_18325 [Verrucomicrobia bacterium]|nr:hypothetical protein [Verrucomicrobiota bacterium]